MEHATGNETQRSKNNERVHRFRRRMEKEGCTRLEVTIGTDVAEKLRSVAKHRGIPVWQCAEEAIEEMARKHRIGNEG